MNIFPELKVERIAIKLKSLAEKKIKQGHPWVFDQSIKKQNKEGKSGDLAIIYDAKKNNVIAVGLLDPTSPIRIKILSNRGGVKIDEDWFINQIQKAYQLRTPLFETETNSYRLIFGENDGLPGVIADVYDDTLVLKLYSSIWFPYLNTLVKTLLYISNTSTVVLRLSRNVTSLKHNYDLKDGQVIYGNLPDETIIFKEHGIKFSANVIKGHKTGYFLDHRHNRKRVGELAKDKNVLDVFSYAGGFTVHALVGGARKVTSLDISKQALDLAKANVELNPYTGIHTCIAADAFEGLSLLKEQRKKFDIVVIDPPSFAKSASEVNRAKVSYERLTRLGLDLVAPKGILVMASCSSRIIAQDFFEIVETTIQSYGRNFTVLEKTYHDIDHPISFTEGAYLKCGYYRIK